MSPASQAALCFLIGWFGIHYKDSKVHKIFQKSSLHLFGKGQRLKRPQEADIPAGTSSMEGNALSTLPSSPYPPAKRKCEHQGQGQEPASTTTKLSGSLDRAGKGPRGFWTLKITRNHVCFLSELTFPFQGMAVSRFCLPPFSCFPSASSLQGNDHAMPRTEKQKTEAVPLKARTQRAPYLSSPPLALRGGNIVPSPTNQLLRVLLGILLPR